MKPVQEHGQLPVELNQQQKRRKKKKKEEQSSLATIKMASITGENEQGMRKIIDLTRMISIIILILHFYYNCYVTFREWKFTTAITDRILQNIAHSGLFNLLLHQSCFQLPSEKFAQTFLLHLPLPPIAQNLARRLKQLLLKRLLSSVFYVL